MVPKTRSLLIALWVMILITGSIAQPVTSAPQTTYTIPTLKPVWTTGIISDDVGLAGLVAEDLDQDGTLDVASCSGGYAYIINYTSSFESDTVWYSTYLNCYRLASGDRDADGVSELYIATQAGKVIVVDGLTHRTLGSFSLDGGVAAEGIAVGDVDGDDAQEIVATYLGATLVYDAATFALEWLGYDLGGGQVAVGNIDADDLLEIVVNGETGRVLNASTQSLEWGYTGGFGLRMDLGDVDGDGRDEIAFVEDWDRAAVLDGDTKTIKWSTNDLGDLAEVAVADVDGNGSAEVIIGNGQWGYITGYRGSDGAEQWSISNPRHGVSAIAAGDADADGVSDVLWGGGLSDSGEDALLIGSWVSETLLWQSDDLDGPLLVAAGDVDNDGEGEIVMASYSTTSGYEGGTLRVYDGETRLPEWSTIANASYYNLTHLAIGQLDADPPLEILVGGDSWYSTRLQSYDGSSHVIEWDNNTLSDYATYDLAIADLDDDPVDEILVALSDRRVLVLNGASDVIEWDSQALDDAIRSLAVGDLDGDGAQDLAVLTGKSLYVYDTDDWVRKLYQPVSGGVEVAIAEADAFGGGELLLVTSSGTADNFLQAWDGDTFQVNWSASLGYVTVHELASYDLDQDGLREVILLGGEGAADSGKSLLWIGSRTFPYIWENKIKSYWGVINSLALSDVDNDEAVELLFGASNLIQVDEISTATVNKYLAYLPFTRKPCLPLYVDNFSDPTSGWPVGDSGEVLYEYNAGEYRLLLRPDYWGAGARPGFQAIDYAVSVDVRNPYNVFGSYGIAFGIAYDWSSFYSLEIYPDGWFGLYRFSSGSYTALAEAASPAIHQGSASNQIKVERIGDQIHVYANGVWLASATDYTLMDLRYLGVVAYTYDKKNLDIRFDNYTVYPITCSASTTGVQAWQLTPGTGWLEPGLPGRDLLEVHPPHPGQ